MQASAPPPIPLLVISGYLGAGKTTLVNHLLRQARGLRIAVLVNDFGEVSIDADLILAEAGRAAASDSNGPAVLALAGGCLCCSYGADLVGALKVLAQRDPAPELMLVECSGVALPQAVMRTARLATEVQLLGSLCVADASRMRRLADDPYVGDTVRRQWSQSQALLLGHQDRLSPAERAAASRWIRRAAPSAELLRPPLQVRRLLQGFGPDAPVDASFAGWGQAMRRPAAEAGWISCTVDLPPAIELQALGASLAPGWLDGAATGRAGRAGRAGRTGRAATSAQPGPAAPQPLPLRAKAWLQPAGEPARVLQVASGRWQVQPAGAPTARRPVASANRLVVILPHRADGQAPQASDADVTERLRTWLLARVAACPGSNDDCHGG